MLYKITNQHLAYHCCAEITGPKECCPFGKVKCVRATENGSQFLRIPHNWSFGVKKEEATTMIASSKEKNFHMCLSQKVEIRLASCVGDLREFQNSKTLCV